MAFRQIYDLIETTDLSNKEKVLVYQDKRLKRVKSSELFYSKEYIDNNIISKRDDIIKTLLGFGVTVPADTSLYNLINYIDEIDLFEIGTRRMVHDGTDTSVFTGNPLAYNNPKTVSMGVPQLSPILDRVYKIDDIMTVIPAHTPDPVTDLIYAGISNATGMARNDFYGGDYASDNWKNGIYPWNQMSKVQDEYGNYFTRCPLYFIKTEFVTTDGIDITESWPIIPNEYITSVIYEYVFVSKAKLPGYRPAEFFYKYIPREMVEDPDGEYIYIEDLNCYHKSVFNFVKDIRYSIGITPVSTYTKILTNYHDFGCYECSIGTQNGSTVIKSVPNAFHYGDSMSNYRIYIGNYDKNSDIKNYHILDMRSYNDFYCTLMETEFATIYVNNSIGVFNLSSSKIYESAENTNTFKVTKPFRVNSYVSIGNSNWSSNIALNRKVLSYNDLGNNIYEVTIDGNPVSVITTHSVWNESYITGYTDTINYRTAIENSDDINLDNYPFKWNWIENIIGNAYKHIDGIISRRDMDVNGLYEVNTYICNNPYLYSNTITSDYEKVSYVGISQYIDSSGNVIGTPSGTIAQLGYDILHPYARIASKFANITNSCYYSNYSMMYQDNNTYSYFAFNQLITGSTKYGLRSIQYVAAPSRMAGSVTFIERDGE